MASHTPEARMLPIGYPDCKKAPPPNEKAKHGKRQPIPGERAHAREQRIGKDRKGHRALAAEIVGKHAAEQAADRPTEYGYRNDRAGIGGDERVLGRVQELMQRNANGENKCEHFEAIERPPEVRGDKRFPLRPVERAIPWRILESADFAHDPLPDLCSACPAGRSRMKAYANIPRAWKSGLCRQARWSHFPEFTVSEARVRRTIRRYAPGRRRG